MRIALLSYSLGIALMSLAPRTLYFWEWFLLLGLMLSALSCHHYYPKVLKIIVPLIFAIVGLLWSDYKAKSLLNSLLPAIWESQDIWVEGYVASKSNRKKLDTRDGRSLSYERFDFDVHQAYPHAAPNQSLNINRIRLSWYGTEHKILAGDYWRLRVRLKRPHGFANDGTTDYQAYLLAHHISAKGYVRKDLANVFLNKQALRYWHHRVREYLAIKLNALQKPVPMQSLGLIIALGLGDKSMITNESYQVLRDTGVAHLLAISGLHIGFVALLFYKLFSWLARFSTHALLFMPANCWGAVGGMLASLVYAALAGFSLPTQRALIMVSVAFIAVLMRRRLGFSTAFCLALAMILTWQPLAIFLVGFWLSFIAVGALLLYFRNFSFAPVADTTEINTLSSLSLAIARIRTQTINWSIGLLHTQYAVGIALLLPQGIFFHSIPALSFITNLLAVPLVSLLVVPLILAGLILLWLLPSLAYYLFYLADGALNALVSSLQWCLYISGDWSVWHASTWPVPLILLALVASMTALLASRWSVRLVSLLFLLPLVIPIQHDDLLRIEWLDVGQGQAVLIQTRNHNILYDAGPRYGGSDAGAIVITPVLRARGIKSLDLMLLSHRDIDHIGGANSVLDTIEVKRLVTSKPDAIASAKAALFPQAQHCQAKQKWLWDDVHFELLHPPTDYHATNENDRSCVLLLRVADHNFVLTGDISKEVEETLVAYLQPYAPISVINASHHGSATSSAMSWVQSLRPRYVIYATGYKNHFNHPHPDVVARFNKVDSIAYNLAITGSVLMRVNKNGMMLEPSTWRQRHRRYWHNDT